MGKDPEMEVPNRPERRGRPLGRFDDFAGQRLTGAMVAGDLEEAGIPLVVSGRCFDFHSLRGQYATRLVRAGVGLAVAQKLLQHSTPTLTANVYTHLNLGDLGSAVAEL